MLETVKCVSCEQKIAYERIESTAPCDAIRVHSVTAYIAWVPKNMNETIMIVACCEACAKSYLEKQPVSPRTKDGTLENGV